MKVNHKKSIILLEQIISIVLISVIFLISSKFILAINSKNKSDYSQNITKLEFETTKIFLQNMLTKEKNLDNIIYLNDTILYKNTIVQENVTKFDIINNSNIYTINFCINLYSNICEKIVLKL